MDFISACVRDGDNIDVSAIAVAAVGAVVVATAVMPVAKARDGCIEGCDGTYGYRELHPVS